MVASCTMACLAELRYATVITDEEGAAGFAIVLIPAAFGYIALVDAAVVMQQNGGNVQSVGTRHAIFAVVARDDRIGKHYLRRIFQQSQFFFRARVEGRIRCGDCPADVPYTSCRSVPSVPWGSSRQSGMPRKLHSLADDAVSGVPPSGRSVWIAVLPTAVP